MSLNSNAVWRRFKDSTYAARTWACQTRSRGSWLFSSVVVAAMLASAASAYADEAAKKPESANAFCEAARTEGSAHQRSGRMLAARSAFRRCATATCPSQLADACTALYGEVSAAVARLKVTARGPDGKTTHAVRVLRGDKVLAQQLDDVPLALDPGEYRLRFELAGAVALERTLRLRSGDQRQPLSLDFRAQPVAAPVPSVSSPQSNAALAAPPAPPSSSNQAPPALVNPLATPAVDDNNASVVTMWIGGSVMSAGLLTGVVAGMIALERRGGIRARCELNMCSEEDIAEGRIPAHAATAGVVAAGAGAATLFVGWLLSVDEDEPALLPVAGLGWMGLSGRF